MKSFPTELSVIKHAAAGPGVADPDPYISELIFAGSGTGTYSIRENCYPEFKALQNNLQALKLKTYALNYSILQAKCGILKP